MTEQYFCWRWVDGPSGPQDQYLTAGGGITTRSDLREYFSDQDAAQAHIDTHHERGEVAFCVQSGLRKGDPGNGKAVAA